MKIKKKEVASATQIGEVGTEQVACMRNRSEKTPLSAASRLFVQNLCAQGHKACDHSCACRQVGRQLAACK